MFKTVAAGGQTTAHGIRMLRQVVKIALIFAVLAWFSTFFYRMYTKVDPDRYYDFVRYFKAIGRWDEHAWTHYSDRLDGLYSFAYKQIKPAFKVSLGVFAFMMGIFQIKGLLGKRTKRVKNKSSIKRTLIKNLFHRGYFLGKASIPKNSETTHFLVTGGTGSGKTNAFHHLLNQVREKGQKAVILDTTGVFVKRYFKEEKKDIILNPFDPKTKHWTPWLDAKNDIDYEALAKAFIPKKASDHDSYWKESAATVFASLLEVYEEPDEDDDKKKPMEALTEMLIAKPTKDLINAVKGTPAMAHISKEGDKSTASIRSTAASYLSCLRYLETPKEGKAFSIGEWMKDDSENGWLFLSCDTSSRDTMKPLLSAWYSTAIRALMALKPSFKRRVWFVNDELPTMDQINGLNTCLTEGRKYGACALLATQSPSQIVDIYGREQAKIITANCMNKIVFRENEPQNAEQLSKLFGNLEVEEIQEGLSYGANDMRDGVNQSKVRRSKALVSATDIQNLKVNHCYLRDNNGKIQKINLGIAKKK